MRRKKQRKQILIVKIVLLYRIAVTISDCRVKKH